VITEKQAAGVEQQRMHEEQMSKIRQENAVKMREATLERYSLMKQIDTLSNGSSDLELVKVWADYFCLLKSIQLCKLDITSSITPVVYIIILHCHFSCRLDITPVINLVT